MDWEQLKNKLFGKPCHRCGKRKRVKVSGTIYCYHCDKNTINSIMLNKVMSKDYKVK